MAELTAMAIHHCTSLQTHPSNQRVLSPRCIKFNHSLSLSSYCSVSIVYDCATAPRWLKERTSPFRTSQPTTSIGTLINSWATSTGAGITRTFPSISSRCQDCRRSITPSSQAIHVLIVPSVPLVRPRSHSTHWNLKVTPSSISTLPRPFSDMGCPNVPQDLVVRLRNPW